MKSVIAQIRTKHELPVPTYHESKLKQGQKCSAVKRRCESGIDLSHE